MMVEGDVDFAEEVVATEAIAVPDHDAQRPRLQLALRHVILHTHTHTHVIISIIIIIVFVLQQLTRTHSLNAQDSYSQDALAAAQNTYVL